jgi:hypothetical protein
VSTRPWGVVKTPARAAPSSLSIVKLKPDKGAWFELGATTRDDAR